MNAGPIPLTIIGGFLGSGKTSLVNHILDQAEGARIAVLVNDFGALNIDAKLIVAVEGETISLANGCVCCTIRDDLLSEVVKLAAREPRPERIVIETSGVSRPVAVAETFLTPAVQSLVTLEALVAVLDAELTVDPTAGYADLAFDQIKTADLVIINKCDLAGSDALPALKTAVRQIVPRARLWETSFGRAPLDLLFAGPQASAERAEPTGPMLPHAAFGSWVYRDRAAWRFSALQAAIEALPKEIYRAKGFLRLALPDKPWGELQMTGRRSWLRLRPRPPEVTDNELLFIGSAGATSEEEVARIFDTAAREGGQIGDQGYQVADLRSLSLIFD